mmetsp:Transcript_6582/g.25411  ORF Transcript_6582/g.25411 Transcript_6582/m.25411 type:complete len:521 (-) Transcript_6582:30-1592(-)
MMRLLRLVLLLIASSSPVAPLWSGTAVAARRGAALHSRAGQGGDFSQRGRSSDGLSRAFRAGVVISAEEEQRLAKEVRLAQDVQSKIDGLQRELGRAPTLLEVSESCDVDPRDTRGILSAGKRAKAALLQANVRMILRIIFEETSGRGFACVNFEREDLLNEGMIALARAIERFDPDRGRLMTYAFPWVQMRIRQAIREFNTPVRVKAAGLDKLRKVREAIGDSEARTGPRGGAPRDEMPGSRLYGTPKIRQEVVKPPSEQARPVSPARPKVPRAESAAPRRGRSAPETDAEESIQRSEPPTSQAPTAKARSPELSELEARQKADAWAKEQREIEANRRADVMWHTSGMNLTEQQGFHQARQKACAIKDAYQKAKTSAEEVERLLGATRFAFSLDSSSTSATDDSIKLITHVEATLSADVGEKEGEILATSSVIRLRDVLRDTLTPRQHDIINAVMGLSDGEPMSMRRFSDMTGVNYNTASADKFKALERLRKNPEVLELLLHIVSTKESRSEGGTQIVG